MLAFAAMIAGDIRVESVDDARAHFDWIEAHFQETRGAALSRLPDAIDAAILAATTQ